MKFDFFTTLANYENHVRPVWEALPEKVRGTWYRGVRHPPEDGTPILVASFQDLCATTGRPVAFLEHGSGSSYGNPNNGGFSGGAGRDSVGLFLCPSERVAQRNLATYPDAVVAVVGVPALDPWHPPSPRVTDDPVVAFAWHWDMPGPREGGTAFHHFKHGLRAVAEEFHVLGHGHPRWFRGGDSELVVFYRHLGIEVVPTFAEILDRADLLVCDVSSVLFEFASTGRPVVLLDDPAWNMDCGHWPRFAPVTSAVGLHTDNPAAMVETIRLALEDPPVVRRAREAAVAEVYAYTDGRASERAAQALCDWSPDFSKVRRRGGRG